MKWLLMYDPLSNTYQIEDAQTVLARNSAMMPPTAPRAYPIAGGELRWSCEREIKQHRELLRRKLETKNQMGEREQANS